MAVYALQGPADFSLLAVIASHGWYQLAPFEFDPARQLLSTCLRLPTGRPLAIAMREGSERRILVQTAQKLPPKIQDFVVERLHRMLGLGISIEALHKTCQSKPALRWIAERRLGRLLRSQDLYEDALKTLLTTNCTWKQTIGMVAKLVRELGVHDPKSGLVAFPAPEAVVEAGEKFLSKELKVGYRAKACVELAQLAVDGELAAIEKLPTDVAAVKVKAWRGFGDYAVNSLLLLLGRCDRLVVDSWAMARAKKLHFRGRDCTEDDIRKVYERYGPQRALVAWFDLNREHYSEWPPRWQSPVSVAEAAS